MNKVGKTAMYMMGAGLIAGMSYYAGLPKKKKNEVKDTMMNMMRVEKNCVEDCFD